VVDFIDTHIGSDTWTDDLPVPLDAVVSTTALHYLPPEGLFTVYKQVHALLRPGGLLLNADHLFQEDPTIRRLAAAVGQGHATRRDEVPTEDWHTWWENVAASEEFRELLRERDRRGLGPGSDNGLTAQQHTELMRKAGFNGVGSVWQYGHSCVLAAVRS
jgi:SAM-dependent methyltransferase